MVFIAFSSLFFSRGSSQSSLLFCDTDPLLGSSSSLWILSLMGSSDRLFNRQRSLHEILGGGQGMPFSLLVIISFDWISQLYWWFVLICISQSFLFISLVLFVYVHFGTVFNCGIAIWAAPVLVCFSYLFAFSTNGKWVRIRRK